MYLGHVRVAVGAKDGPEFSLVVSSMAKALQILAIVACAAFAAAVCFVGVP